MMKRIASPLRNSLALLSLLPGLLLAQNYPVKPITLIVPFAAGGGTDSIARDVAKTLSDKLGQAVIVDNKGGGGGTIGAHAVAKAQPDGYTLLFATSTFITSAAAQTAAPYNVEKDFAPVAMIGRGPLLVVASKGLGVKSIAQLRVLGQARAQGLDYCSAGKGSINHLAGELFHQRTQLDMTHVPYKGSGPAMTDVMAGQVPVFFASLGSSLSHIRGGKLRAVAVVGKTRSPVLPEVPTFAESGLPGYEIYEWNGVFVPAGTPAAVIERLSAELAAVLKEPDIRQRLEALGADVIGSSPAELEVFRRAEISKWTRLAKDNAIALD